MPTDDKQVFSVNGEAVVIPSDNVDKFKKDYPDAKPLQVFKVGDDTVAIPDEHIEGFKKDYPDAQPLFVKKKEETNFPYGYGNVLQEGQNGSTTTPLKNKDGTVPLDFKVPITGTEAHPLPDLLHMKIADLQMQENEAKRQKDVALGGVVYKNFKKIQDNLPESYDAEKEKLDKAGDGKFNQDDSFTYVDEKGDKKTLRSDEAMRVMREYTEEQQRQLREHATPLGKVGYAAVDVLSNYPIQAVGGEITGGVKIAKAFTTNPKDNPEGFADNVLEGMAGAMDMFYNTLKFIPATAPEMATYTMATDAAAKAADELKGKGKLGDNVYWATRLITQPYETLQGQPTNEFDRNMGMLVDNFINLGEIRLAKGILKGAEEPPPEEPQKQLEAGTPQKQLPEGTPPPKQLRSDREFTMVSDVVSKLKDISEKKEGAKLDIGDLPVVADIIKNSSPEDIKKAGEQTDAKAEQDKKDLADNKVNVPKGDLAPDDNFPNLNKKKVKELRKQNFPDHLIQAINDKVEAVKVNQEVEKIIHPEEPKEEIKPEEKPKEQPKEEEKPKEEVKPKEEPEPPQGGAPQGEKPAITPEEQQALDEAELERAREGEVKPTDDIVKMGFDATPFINLAKGTYKTLSDYTTALKEAAKQLPPKTDFSKFAKVTWDLTKSLAKNTIVKDHFYKQVYGKEPIIKDNEQIFKAQDTFRNNLLSHIKKYGTDPEAFKRAIEGGMIHYEGLTKSNPDNMEANSQIAKSYALLHEAIPDPSINDIKNLTKILAGENKVSIGGEPKYAWSVAAMKAAYDMGKPEQELSNQQYKAVVDAITPVKQFKELNTKGNKTVNDYVKDARRIGRSPQFLPYLSSVKTRKAAKKVVEDYSRTLTTDRNRMQYNYNKHLAQEYLNHFTTPKEQENVNSVLTQGHFRDRQNYSKEELKAMGLNNKEIGLYNHLQDVLNVARQYIKDGMRTEAGYDNMTIAEKEIYEQNEPEWLKTDDKGKYTTNNGYFPYLGHGNYMVMFHGLTADGKEEAVQHQLFNDLKEANEYAKGLSKSTYNFEGENKYYKGVTGTIKDKDRPELKTYERADNKDPFVVDITKDDFDPGLLTALKDPDAIYSLLGKAGVQLNDPAYELVAQYLKNLKVEKGKNPSLTFSSNRMQFGKQPSFEDAMTGLKELGQNSIHLYSKKKAEADFTDNIKPLRDSPNARDKKFVNETELWRQHTLQQYADPKFYRALGTGMMVNYLAAKPMFPIQQLFKNVLTMPAEGVSRLEDMGLSLPKRTLVNAKFMGKSAALAHQFLAGKLFPGGKDEYGRKISKSDWVDNPDSQIGKVMNMLYAGQFFGQYDIDWTTDKDGQGDKLWQKIKGWSMLQTPFYTRAMSGAYGVLAAWKAGLKTDQEVYEYAHSYVKDTKYSYDKFNRPYLVQGMTKSSVANELLKLGTLFQNTHWLNLQWFYKDLGDWEKTMYKVAPRALLGGVAQAAPITGVAISNILLAMYEMYENSNRSDDKKEKIYLNPFSEAARANLHAHLENSKMSQFWKDELENGIVDAAVKDMGVKSGAPTKQVVELGHQVPQDFFPSIETFGMYGTFVKDSYKTLRYLDAQEMMKAAENAPLAAVRNGAKAIDWFHNGVIQYQSDRLEYVPSAWEASEIAFGATPDRIATHQDAIALGKSVDDGIKSIREQVNMKLEHAINKKDMDAIETYYYDPSEENRNNLFGKDLQKDVWENNRTNHNGVTALLNASNMDNDGKLEDLGKWKEKNINTTYDDTLYVAHTDKKSEKLTYQNWIRDYIKNLPQKQLNNDPELLQFAKDLKVVK